MVEPGLTDGARQRGNAINKKRSHYFKVRERERLRKAWLKVRENGLASRSEKTVTLIREFEKRAEKEIERIYRQLQQNKWTFAPGEGVPIPRGPEKKPRPLVVSPIPNRIVQRSILDVLQENPAIKDYIMVETSFGGIKKRGVRDAIVQVQKSIKEGAQYFIKTDIKEFFRAIPRLTVIDKVATHVKEDDFIQLLSEATTTELSNMEKLRYRDLFPSYEIGVAQGCCLSPLMGNILLEDFDGRMNGRGVVCFRYIDDFVILGKNYKKVRAAFESGRAILQQFGLEVYDPEIEKANKPKGDESKAKSGLLRDGLDFLGCKVYPGLIYPNAKSCEKLFMDVRDRIEVSLAAMSAPGTIGRKKKSLADTLMGISNVLKGWGNGYSFCNHLSLMKDLDNKIDDLLADYLRQYRIIRTKLDKRVAEKDGRRLLGVHLLQDSKFDPIA
jgi:retron-type reverse transcriptase